MVSNYYLDLELLKLFAFTILKKGWTFIYEQRGVKCFNQDLKSVLSVRGFEAPATLPELLPFSKIYSNKFLLIIAS